LINTTKLSNSLEDIIEFISVIFYIIFFIAIFIQVVSRYIFNSPIVWSEELARYINIWFVFFSSSILLKHGEHLSVDLIDKYLYKMNVKIRGIHSLILNIIILLLVTSLIYGSSILVIETWSIELVTLKIPRGLIFLSLTISGCFMFIFTIENIIKDITKITKGGDN